jgi:hypothetical protein
MGVKNLLLIVALAGLSLSVTLPRANVSLPALKPSGKKGLGTLHLPIIHKKKDLFKRQDPTSIIYNEDTLYLIQCKSPSW